MTDSITFDDYTITVVQGSVDTALAGEIATFWLANGALADPQEARRRVAEVVCVARNRAREIVGLNTVYLSTLGRPPRAYYLYRAFIRPADRRLGLARCMSFLCYEHLRTHAPLREILGLALVVENAKFATEPGQAYLEQSGGRHIGNDQIGRHVWTFDFADQALNEKVFLALGKPAQQTVPAS